MRTLGHLTQKGLEEIRNIKACMNKGRALVKPEPLSPVPRKKGQPQPVTIKSVDSGQFLPFLNMLGASTYLASINIKVTRQTIAKYINSGKPFKGYLFNSSSFGPQPAGQEQKRSFHLQQNKKKINLQTKEHKLIFTIILEINQNMIFLRGFLAILLLSELQRE